MPLRSCPGICRFVFISKHTQCGGVCRGAKVSARRANGGGLNNTKSFSRRKQTQNIPSIIVIDWRWSPHVVVPCHSDLLWSAEYFAISAPLLKLNHSTEPHSDPLRLVSLSGGNKYPASLMINFIHSTQVNNRHTYGQHPQPHIFPCIIHLVHKWSREDSKDPILVLLT